MVDYIDGLTVGELKEAISGLDDKTPVVVSANILAIPILKKYEVSSIYPDIEKAFFLKPSVRLGIDGKDF